MMSFFVSRPSTQPEQAPVKIVTRSTIMLCLVSTLLLLTLQWALAGAPKVEVGSPPKYAFFTFPPQAPVAKILYVTTTPGQIDEKKERWEPALAQGRIRLPINCEMKIDLSFASLEHMNVLEQLYPCRVVWFSAANLDFEDRHMQYARGFKDLRRLNLVDTLVTDKSLTQIGLFEKLSTLRLNATDVTGSGFGSLKNLHNLCDLNIEGIDLQPGTIARLKPLMANLQSFDVAKTGLTKKDAAILKELKVVHDLSISANRQMDNDCVNYLGHLKELKSLSIFDTSITDKSIPILIKMPQLRTVKVRDKEFWTSIKHQTKYGQVEFIDVSRSTTIQSDFFSPLHLH